MSEIEVPLEKVQEDLHHHVAHGSTSKSNMIAAVLSAVLAVLAAISALFAGHTSNEAMIKQIESSDQWSFYQSKGIKSMISEMRLENLVDKSETPNEKNLALKEKIEKYKEEQNEIKNEAEKLHNESRFFLYIHEKLSTAVTCFQIAIALAAIAVLVQRPKALYISGALGIFGLIYMAFAFGRLFFNH